MNRWIVAALLLLADIAGAGAPEKESRTGLKRYRITEVKGQVLAWEPWTSQWRAVAAGDDLWESTLVEIGRGGTFSFQLAASEGFSGVQGETVQVTLGTPIVVRLNDDVMRTVKLSSYFIPDVPGKITSGEKDMKQLMYKSLNEAWERFAAVATSKGVDVSWLKPPASESESAISMRAKKLRLITPAKDATIMLPKLPAELRVGWQKVPAEGITYAIRLWKLDEQRPEQPLAYTQLDFHNLKIEREGGYYIQVTSADDRWQSEVHQIFVSLPIAGRMANKTNLRGISSLPIALELPPQDFIYRAAKLPAAVAFQWDTLIPSDPSQPFELEIQDEKGKPLVKRTVSGKAFQARFNRPGKYRWAVSAVFPATKSDPVARRVTSDVRVFQLEHGPADKDPMAALLFANRSGVLYLETDF